MKCKHCDGTGATKGWISEPCAYCGGSGELPDDFTEMMKLRNCKKCGGEAVFSGVFDDPKTYRFPECIECGARAEGNSVKDSWYERARKWNEQNTMTNEEWRKTYSTEEFAEALTKVVLNLVAWNNDPKPSEVRNILKAWLKQPHTKE